MSPEWRSRPSAEELLKKRQLLSDEQRQLIVERNKANAANMALDAQMVSPRALSSTMCPDWSRAVLTMFSSDYYSNGSSSCRHRKEESFFVVILYVEGKESRRGCAKCNHGRTFGLLPSLCLCMNPILRVYRALCIKRHSHDDVCILSFMMML